MSLFRLAVSLFRLAVSVKVKTSFDKKLIGPIRVERCYFTSFVTSRPLLLDRAVFLRKLMRPFRELLRQPSQRVRLKTHFFLLHPSFIFQPSCFSIQADARHCYAWPSYRRSLVIINIIPRSTQINIKLQIKQYSRDKG